MPKSAEQVRKGQILKSKRLEVRPRLSVKRLAERIDTSPRAIEYLEAGDTWNQGTANLILKELGLDESVFGPDPTPEQKSMADIELWSSFPDEVQVQLIVLGKWLASRSDTQRFYDAAALAEFIAARSANR